MLHYIHLRPSHTCSVDLNIGGLPHTISKRKKACTTTMSHKQQALVVLQWCDEAVNTLTEHGRSLPLSSRSTGGHIARSNIMKSRVTLINHLGAHSGALAPHGVGVREGRGRAAVDLWGPKRWHAALNQKSLEISRKSCRPISHMIPAVKHVYTVPTLQTTHLQEEIWWAVSGKRAGRS